MGSWRGWVVTWSIAGAIGWGCAVTGPGVDNPDCPIGSEGCSCTMGMGCDLGLYCIDGVCHAVAGGTESNASVSASMSGEGTASEPPDDDTTSAGGTTMSVVGSSTDGGGETTLNILLDVGQFPDLGDIPTSGCQAIDILFVLDGSASMAEERAALAATGAFTSVILTLEGLHDGDIDYRVGVTDDDDHGFLVPAGWLDPDPWFDSADLDTDEIADAFNGAVSQVGGLGGASTGCEHVLTSGVDLLDGNDDGFVRDDALLVLVLVTDVDDYGDYDQSGGNSCGLGCGTPPSDLDDLYDTLETLKGDAAGFAAIVVAGDPSLAGGFNFCNQPASCGCVQIIPDFWDCDVYHASRLYEFAEMLGENGWAGDLCDGSDAVPDNVEAALTESIEIACENYTPAG